MSIEKPLKSRGPTKRIRRTSDEAKRVILDAAESLVSHNGPGGLRLQDVAAVVGLTHPVILHHFGSRDGLMRALNERILDDLHQRLFSILQRYEKPSLDIVDQLLDSVFTVFRGGLAQRLVWLDTDAVPADDPPSAIFARFVDGMHNQRLSVMPATPRRAGRTPKCSSTSSPSPLWATPFSGPICWEIRQAGRRIVRSKYSAPGCPGSCRVISSITKRPDATPSHTARIQCHALLA